MMPFTYEGTRGNQFSTYFDLHLCKFIAEDNGPKLENKLFYILWLRVWRFDGPNASLERLGSVWRR